MELVLVSYPEFFEGEIKIINNLLKDFNFTFHLRKPEAGIDELRNILNRIPYEFHEKIVVSNFQSLQAEFNIKGIHFSTMQRPEKLNKEGELIYGTSCHSVEEMRELENIYDYMYISPVFKSISKEGYEGSLKLNEVREYLKEKRNARIIALGGVDAGKIDELAGFSFDGMAVLGAVWTNCPEQLGDKVLDNFKRIYKCLN